MVRGRPGHQQTEWHGSGGVTRVGGRSWAAALAGPLVTVSTVAATPACEASVRVIAATVLAMECLRVCLVMISSYVLTSQCPRDVPGPQEWRHHGYYAASTTIATDDWPISHSDCPA